MLTAFEKNYPKMLNVLSLLTDALLALVRTLVLSLGIPIILGAVIYVEIPRVAHGIEFFESDSGFAYLSAMILVLSNKVVEFLIVYKKRKDGIVTVKYEFGMRVVLDRIVSFLFQKNKTNSSHAYESVSGMVTISILSLALLGSMRSVIANYNDVIWYTALWLIMTESNLLSILTWAGGLLFAYTLVSLDQSLSNYVSVYTADLIESMSSRSIELSAETSPTDDARITKSKDGTFIAKSPIDGWEKEYTDFDKALSGIRSHDSYASKSLQTAKAREHLVGKSQNIMTNK